MTRNMKLLAAGCLALFLGAICCLITVVSINFMYLNELTYSEVTKQYDENPDFPTNTPEVAAGEAPRINVGVGEFLEYECPFDTQTEIISCGYLGVPEDHHDPTSDTITLAVAIIQGLRDNSNPPLFYLEGGPGGSALDGAEALWLDSPLIDGRAVVLFDQRGTGYSSPTLNCTEYEDPRFYGMDEFIILRACRDRLLDSGIDLDLYNSQQSAADIQTLRTALGYPQIDLLGVSYGTRLALTVMRDYPEGIRSVILDSVFPPHVDAYTEEPQITLAAFTTLAAGCQKDPECQQAYPDLETVLLSLIEQLEAAPAEIEFWDGYLQEYYYQTYFGQDLINTLVDAMYDTHSIPYIPAFIYAFAAGDFSYSFDILAIPGSYAPSATDHENTPDEDISNSEGAYFSVTCYEESWFNSVPEAERLVSGYPSPITDLLVFSVEEALGTCQMWGSKQPPLIENQAVRSEIPTLLLNGEYDPVTPADWAVRAAENLPNSQLFIFPGYGHAVIDASTCPVEMMIDFLADPDSPVTHACFEAINPVDFVINP